MLRQAAGFKRWMRLRNISPILLEKTLVVFYLSRPFCGWMIYEIVPVCFVEREYPLMDSSTITGKWELVALRGHFVNGQRDWTYTGSTILRLEKEKDSLAKHQWIRFLKNIKRCKDLSRFGSVWLLNINMWSPKCLRYQIQWNQWHDNPLVVLLVPVQLDSK